MANDERNPNDQIRMTLLQSSRNSIRIWALGFFGAHLDTIRPLTPALSPSDGERERRKSPPRSRQFSLSPSDGERVGVRGRTGVVSRGARFFSSLVIRHSDFFPPLSIVIR